MSRIGRKAIVLPKGTSVTIKGDKVVVKGTKGELDTPLMPEITVDVLDVSNLTKLERLTYYQNRLTTQIGRAHV